jgi:hypothetical protein
MNLTLRYHYAGKFLISNKWFEVNNNEGWNLEPPRLKRLNNKSYKLILKSR